MEYSTWIFYWEDLKLLWELKKGKFCKWNFQNILKDYLTSLLSARFYSVGCPPEIAVVYATAVFENCPSSQLGQDDVESLHRFLESENHLKQNILKVNLQDLSSRSFRNNMFTHTLSVELHIATSRLSETPVNYIRRNLEKSEWKRSNGTLIGLSRIHS